MYPDAWVYQRHCLWFKSRQVHMALPKCVDFGNVDLGKGAEVTPTLPPLAVEIPFMQGSSDGKTTCPARLDHKPYEYYYTIAMR